MKKTFRMENLDCANCAAKMEDAISRLPGVESVRLNFMTQKLVLAAEESRFETLLDEAAKICRKIEPDCAILR